MKKHLIISMLIILSMLVTACGPNRDVDNSTNTTNDGEETKPSELTIWSPEDEHQLNSVKEIAEKFAEETGIKVNVVPMSMSDQEEAVKLDGPAGKGPDLFFQPGVGALSVQGLVKPVQVDANVLELYTPESLEALSYEGELYGLPAVVETYALYYNKNRVPEAPETMDDLNKIAQAQTNDATDEFGFLYDATNFYFTYALMSGYGGYVFGSAGDQINIDDIGLANEGSIKAGELLSYWYNEGFLPKSGTMDVVNGLFTTGKVGAVINGPWALNEYKTALGDQLAVTYLPKLDNGEYPRSFIGVKGWMLSEFTKSPYWATKLAIHLTSDESARKYFEDTAEIPPNVAILTDDKFQEDELLAGFLTQLTRGEAFPNRAELSEVWDPMADALFFISQGDDPKEALEAGVQNIKNRIEMNYK